LPVQSPRAGDDGFEDEFLAALALHDHVPSPFERARTQLRYGERRARRKTDARLHLEHARATFERHNARPWADRARVELNALGIRIPQTPAPANNALTPQELRVATTISKGSTNREASAALFWSPKTIEAPPSQDLSQARRSVSHRARRNARSRRHPRSRTRSRQALLSQGRAIGSPHPEQLAQRPIQSGFTSPAISPNCVPLVTSNP
jgi:hypothetical protein